MISDLESIKEEIENRRILNQSFHQFLEKHPLGDKILLFIRPEEFENNNYEFKEEYEKK